MSVAERQSRRRGRGGRRGPCTPKKRLPLDVAWQRPTPELLSRLANVPSRADRKRPKLKRDLAENVDRAYQAIWRRARASGSAAIDTTWAQFAVACGYEGTLSVPDDRERLAMLGAGSCRRYLQLLQEAGLLVYGGIQDANGAWERLDIVLLEPPAWDPHDIVKSVATSS